MDIVHTTSNAKMIFDNCTFFLFLLIISLSEFVSVFKQPTLSQSKRHNSVSVSAATVATQVGVSSSIPAKQRNPGQRQIVPTKHFGEYHGSDKITQLATDIPPGALNCVIFKTDNVKSLVFTRSVNTRDSISSAF